MGLSSFWTAIKKPRFSDSAESRKHVDRVYDHHDTVSPVHVVGDEPPHHFDAIYDTHHHILPSQNSGPKRHPSSPPRIHSPPLKSKKHSLWKSASLKIKPTQTSDALKHENSTKRRSFWQQERKESSTAPAVQPSEPLPKREVSKRRSFWRSEPENDQLLPTNDTTTADVKAKRSSRRLSLRRSVSSQSSKRNSLRFSFLANGAGDSDDEDIPAVPAIPANIQRQKSRAKDPGRHMSMGASGMVQPGTAITSDDVHGTAAPKSRNSLKRQSLSKLMTNRKSTSDIHNIDNPSNKRKRRSWFSVHGSESSPETAVPPMPTLYNASGAPMQPSEVAFHTFLHNAHNRSVKTQAASDYERFLRASRAYDASVPTPPHLSQRNSFEVHAPRPVSTAAPTALPQIKPRNPRRASHCRPKKADRESDSSGSPTSPSMLSNEQQREWAKLRQLMDDGRSQPSGSESSDNGLEDDEGVMGMLRELSRDEDEYEKTRARKEKRLRDRQRYLGIGAFENKDALAALEAGATRR